MGQNSPGTTGLDDIKYHDIIKCKTTTFIKGKVKHRVGLLWLLECKGVIEHDMI